MLKCCRKKCFFVFAYFGVCFPFCHILINGRSRECCNEAWHYLIHLVEDWVTILLKLKDISLIFSSFVWQLSQKCRMSSSRNIMCERTLTSLLVKSYIEWLYPRLLMGCKNAHWYQLFVHTCLWKHRFHFFSRKDEGWRDPKKTQMNIKTYPDFVSLFWGRLGSPTLQLCTW